MAANSDQKKENPAPGTDLGRVEAQARQAGKRGLPPVHLWNPPFCGDLDMRIAADGTWFYMGSPIGRKPLVKLFGSVLRHDDDGKFYLVTPVEKIGITVDDAPMVAVAMSVAGKGKDQVLTFTTNLDDEVCAGAEHVLRFAVESETGGLKPYIHVRGRLEALVARSVFYDLVALGTDETVDGVAMFGVWSAEMFFAMAPSRELAGLR